MSVDILKESINNFSFLRCASCSLPVRIADIEGNKKLIIQAVEHAHKLGCNLLIFQPLVITSSSCESLFFDDLLLEKSIDAVFEIANKTAHFSLIICVGFPMKAESTLYDAVAVLYKGKVIAINALAPTIYTGKYFKKSLCPPKKITLHGEHIIFGSELVLNIIFASNSQVKFTLDSDFSTFRKDDIQIACIFSRERTYVGREKNIVEQYKVASHTCSKAFLFASPSATESYGESIYSNFTFIAEKGHILSSSELATENTPIFPLSYADIDTDCLGGKPLYHWDEEASISINLSNDNMPSLSSLKRPVSTRPFISFDPPSALCLQEYIDRIFYLQSFTIKERLKSIGIEKVVLGVSGGIDSSVALLFLVIAFKMNKMDVKNIHAFTLPCFGTTEGTKALALNLCKLLGTSIEEINIKEAVLRHFQDIKQDVTCYDVTFENAQARERAQVLMDKANQLNALVIGSSDLSEIALGFSTFAGDHISMYNLLASLPKTTLKSCLEYAMKNPHLFLQEEDKLANSAIDGKLKQAQSKKAEELSVCISSILETPISPELLPHQDDKITQKTEEILGSYELQDFFIYHVCYNHYSPKKTYALALIAFPEYPRKEILERLKLFYKRFLMSQFKRNCSPESPNITGYALSTWEMPSNVSTKLYMEELESLEKQI